ncbi:hypothetical protein ABIC53_000620 [Microbacterium sp. 1262]
MHRTDESPHRFQALADDRSGVDDLVARCSRIGDAARVVQREPDCREAMAEVIVQFAGRTLSLLREDQIAGALPLGFSLLAVGLLLWTGSLWPPSACTVASTSATTSPWRRCRRWMPSARGSRSGESRRLSGVVLTVGALKRGIAIP